MLFNGIYIIIGGAFLNCEDFKLNIRLYLMFAKVLKFIDVKGHPGVLDEL